jgi:2-polyprenyl-3-methyl-5-hydroxy-6-metoxy-1,4-benzoquinol methylase
MSVTPLEFKMLVSDPSEFRKIVAAVPTTDLYAQTLATQTAIYWPATKTFLGNSPQWKQSTDVLEAGCGPGELLSRLVKEFPRKKFFGIDIESDFIGRAQSNLMNSSVELRVCDVFSFSERTFESVLMWAVLQHLGDPLVAVRRLEKLLVSGGHAFFYDANGKTEIAANPGLPQLNALFTELKERGRGKRDADCLTTVQSRISETPFQIIEALDPVVPIEGESCDLYVVYAFLVSELTKRFYGVESDQSALLREMLDWHRSPDRKMKTGTGRWLVLKKK